MTERLTGRQAADVILDPLRTAPILVLTIPDGAKQPLFNGRFIERELDGQGVVLEVQDSQTYQLNRVLPEAGHVYGGAARVYPVGDDWQSAPAGRLRRLAKSRDEARAQEDALVALMRGEGTTHFSTSSQTITPGAGVLVELAESKRTVSELQAQLREAKEALRTARKAAEESCSSAPERAFDDDEQQLRHELYLTWAEAIPPSSKDDLPLPEYGIGDALWASLEALSPQHRRKALRRIVLLLTGADVRDAHPLRPSGADPVLREDGAVLMRAYVENQTASARRIHYWRGDGGRIDLTRVVLHDDYDA